MIIADNLNNSLNGYIDYIFEKLSENEVNVTRINPDSIDDYESLKNKLCDESISIPALAFYFVFQELFQLLFLR